jgi:hypothetical protein
LPGWGYGCGLAGKHLIRHRRQRPGNLVLGLLVIAAEPMFRLLG